MAAPTFLIELLMIAAVIYIPMCRFSWFRKMSGYTDMFDRENWWGKSSEELFVDKISKAGSGPARNSHDVLICEANLGVRLLVPAMLAFVFYCLVADGLPTLVDWFSALVLFALAAWWAYYMWTFRVEISGHNIATRDWLLRDRLFDLAKLVHAEKDKNGGYRLEFTDGTVCHIIKYVTGHDAMREMILTALQVNAAQHSKARQGLDFGTPAPQV